MPDILIFPCLTRFKDPLSVIFVFNHFKMIFKENYFYRLLRLCSKVCSKKKIRSNEIELKKLQAISRRLLTFFQFYTFFFPSTIFLLNVGGINIIIRGSYDARRKRSGIGPGPGPILAINYPRNPISCFGLDERNCSLYLCV